MNHRVTLSIVLVLCAAACARPASPGRTPALAQALESVRTVAVFPANNRTGDPLLIAGASFFEKYVLPSEHYTVSDALAAEARTQLAGWGFTVVPRELVDTATAGRTPSSAQDAAAVAARNHFEGAVLYVEIKRWEADVPFHPTFVIASVTVTLVEAASGRVLWTAEHPSRPVPTPGIISLADAYAVAAHTLMAEMLAPLAPERPPS